MSGAYAPVVLTICDAPCVVYGSTFLSLGIRKDLRGKHLARETCAIIILPACTYVLYVVCSRYDTVPPYSQGSLRPARHLCCATPFR